MGARPRLILVLGAVLLVAGASPASRAQAGSRAEVKVAVDAPVTAMDQRQEPVNTSPVLTIDPGDARLLVAANRRDAPGPSCALHVSHDGGRRWLPALAAPKLPEGANGCYAPQVVFGPDRVLYVVFVALSGPEAAPMGVYLATSTDQARSFSPTQAATGPGAVMATVAIDPTVGAKGRLHVVWVQANAPPPPHGLPPPPNPIMASFSDDGGRRFSTPVAVSDAQRQRVVAPVLAIGGGRAVHVAYYDLGDDEVDYRGLDGPVWQGQWSLVVATSSDGGSHFAPGVGAEPAVVPPERVRDVFSFPLPALAADQSGNVYAAWHDARNGDWDVFVRHSADGGRSWGPPRRLNNDALGNGRNQYAVRLAAGRRGRLDAVFYDRSEDPANRHSQVVYSSSTDQGLTFARPVRLTSQPSAGVTGDRLALVEDGSSVVAAWADTRNATSTSPGVQDIFAAKVSLPQATRRPWGVLVAAAVSAVGLALLMRRRRQGRQSHEASAETGSPSAA